MFRIEHNVESNEIVEIALTTKELKEMENKAKLSQQKFEINQTESETKAAARQAVLDRLGLTAEEAQLLLGGN